MIDNLPPAGIAAQQDYNDLAALQRLKAQGQDKNAQLREVARQFEAMMVQMMMKSMREANAVFSEGDMTSSNESKFYQDMFDSQLSLSMTQGRGIGIAEAVLRQLQGKFGKEEAKKTEAVVAARSLDAERFRGIAAAVIGAESSENPSADADAIQDAINRLFTGVPEPKPAPAQANATPVLDGTPAAFIDTLYADADQVARELGVDSRVLLSQAALETGWGQKVLQRADGSSSNNFFNIKADANWRGPVVRVAALEYRNGVAVREVSNFRAYATPAESFADYAKLIAGNPRYQQALARVDDPRAYVEALADAGYATDPRYADKVMAVLDNEYWQQLPNTNGSL